MIISKFDPKKDKEPQWVPIRTSFKSVAKQDVFVLGHLEIKMPAIVTSSTVKGVKARLICKKDKVISGPPSAEMDNSNVKELEKWDFDENDQTKPIYFSPPLHVESDFWVEMMNPTDKDAIVNALIHGMIRSKNL